MIGLDSHLIVIGVIVAVQPDFAFGWCERQSESLHGIELDVP
nr:hypothetical protein [Mycobacterium leprae]